ncbi:MAG: nucleoside-diphosphate sugar epimerase/dehydratase [Syntrophobacteraceae bacterium]
MAMVVSFIVPADLVLFYIFGLYRGMWRYTSVVDFWRLAEACLISMLLNYTYVFLLRFEGFPRTILILNAVLMFLMAGGARIFARSLYVARMKHKGFTAFGLRAVRTTLKEERRVIVIGAGSGGEKIVREILQSRNLSLCVVGFLDDDPSKWGRTIHGTRVYGGISLLPEVIHKFNVSQVLISIPSASGTELRRIIEACKGCGVSYKTLPGIAEIMDGKVSITAMRDVNYADLLRRQPFQLDMTGIQNYLMGQTILVTGAGGSIGSELCRQLVRFSPAKLVLFDICEANLFYIQMDLRDLNYHNCELVLGSIQRRELTRGVFSRFRPQVVFHAAAYKHVPMLEQNCRAAIYNNVLGSQVVMESAVEFGVRHFVLVSTDKAVRPASVMGACKRLAELIMQSLRGQGTQFKAVRFGNVVGSSGSVVPLFRRQIELGGPVTVTHPEITRYFMTIPEAAQLIIQAGALAEEGDIFILEMGAPVKITEMARDLIRLSGKEPGTEIEIKFIGLRPGEKLSEELITQGEYAVRTKNERIMVVRSKGVMGKAERQENFRQYLNQQIQDLLRIAGSQETGAVKRKLKEIIPEYNPEACSAGLKDEPSNGSPEPDESLLPDGSPTGVRMGL